MKLEWIVQVISGNVYNTFKWYNKMLVKNEAHRKEIDDWRSFYFWLSKSDVVLLPDMHQFSFTLHFRIFTYKSINVESPFSLYNKTFFERY